ncbi:MAG: M23 family metallopeptidase [Alphaproteobacteria bacterium]|nr:M23 family metallopeptidase [Alphaproteobacteria bacterium]
MLEKQSIDHRGRFHNEMSFGRLLWSNSQARFSAGDPPQEVLRRATGHLSLADIEPTVSPSGGLTVASRDPIKALRDAPQTVDADLIAKHGLILPTDPIKNRIVNAAVHVAELGDPDGDLPRLADIQNGPRIPEPTQDGITAESTLGDRPVWPTRYGQITDGFYREPRKRPGSSTPRRHTAVDIRNPLGEPVFAVLSGKVIVISSASGSGNYLKVAHENGMETSYSHTRSSVSVGDTVDKGDTIGYSDGSGFGSGPHLHFVLRINGERVDPMRNLLDLADRP